MSMLKFIIISFSSLIIANASNLANYLISDTDSWETIEFTKDIRPHCLLSLDGAGFYAIANLYALAYLEKYTGKSVVDLFDGIVANSFSSFIACMLTLPDPDNESRPKYSAQAVLDIICSSRNEICALPFFGNIVFDIYRTNMFKKFLDGIFQGNTYKNRLLPTAVVVNDLLKFDTCAITTIDDEDFYTKDLVLASSALWQLYVPQIVQPIGKEIVYALSDAYTLMRNPTAFGVEFLKKYYGISSNDINVLSLGSCISPEWIFRLFDPSLRLLEKCDLGWSYHRFNIELELACFLSKDLSKESDLIQNRVCDFEAIADKLMVIASEHSADRVKK